METCLFAPRPVLESLIPYVDRFIVDIKLWEAQEHQRYTGQGNGLILENFHFLATGKAALTVRIPLIKDITDTPENIAAIESFVASFERDIPIEKLNYNPLTPSKYRKLAKEFRCS